MTKGKEEDFGMKCSGGMDNLPLMEKIVKA